MPKRKSKSLAGELVPTIAGYDAFLSEVVELLESARRAAGRAVNAVMTATYWEVGRRIVEFEQGGQTRAAYGEGLMKRLAADLTACLGRGFGLSNLKQMKKFYIVWTDPRKGQTSSGLLSGPGPVRKSQTLSGLFAQTGVQAGIRQTASVESPDIGLIEKVQTPSAQFQTQPEDTLPAVATTIVQSPIAQSARYFPLPWSHYVRLLSVKNPHARELYESEALRGGWTVKQLNRQIDTQFYERTALSRNKAAMLTKGEKPRPEDAVTPEEEIKDPFVLEFLGLKDEYSESDLEEALIRQLESFLLELGGDFTFVGRQRRLRIGDEWYRIDLLFYHRRLRCLVVIDLKLGKFTHADAGQMHLYLNYAAEHWTQPDENPPVGLILCTYKDEAVARYALDNLPNKVLAAEYKTVLPDEKLLAGEVERTRKQIEARQRLHRRKPKPCG